MEGSFHDRFVELFEVSFPRVFRLVDRRSGDPDLAADVAQDAFLRLYRRGSMPESPDAWLATVALNLLRNSRSKRSRRLRLLTPSRGEGALGDPGPSPPEVVGAAEERARVRAALDRLPERDRDLLLLRAEGYGYRDMAAALGLHEASLGTLLARARRAFRDAYDEGGDAP